MCRSLVSLSTSEIRRMLAMLMEIMTNTMDSIIRLIRIFIQYARRLISAPVVSSELTIIFAPSQLIRMMQV